MIRRVSTELRGHIVAFCLAGAWWTIASARTAASAAPALLPKSAASRPRAEAASVTARCAKHDGCIHRSRAVGADEEGRRGAASFRHEVRALLP